MNELFAQYESLFRIGAFFGVFAALALLERALPRRALSRPRMARWFVNLSMVAISTALVRFVFPTAVVGVALAANHHNWGLLNYLELSYAQRLVIAFVVLDLSVYLQHVMFHTLPLMWRFHRVHHSDVDCDVTTGLRFHPFEILLSMLIKFVTVAALGAPVAAVVVFEIALNVMSMFTHANVRIPAALERVMRWVIVTPEMHRTHHSAQESETNSNFGFNISLWDRLFGTYIARPESGHEGMVVGLNSFRESRWQSLRWLMYLPFITPVRSYAINRRVSHPEQREP